jgi:WD40 repeat protein
VTDGQWLATAHVSGRIALWQPDAGWPLMVLESPARQLSRSFCFTRDGGWLHVATGDGVVEAWDLRMLERELRERGLGW